jgi:GH15 family glucan-1,4-alpha-glucosidase
VTRSDSEPSSAPARAYVPLRDYAAIGDGRTVALIALDGQVDWLPVPALHTPPVFAGLLDAEHGGRIELRPRGEFESHREYVQDSNVLRITFRTATGSVTVTDALVTGVAGRLPWLELARRVDGVEGEVPMRWAVVPGNTFGQEDEPVTRIDTLHGPLLRAGHIDLVLVGSEHGRLDPHEPGDGFPEGPLSFFGEFTATEGSRHLIALCGTDDEPIHVPDIGNVDRGIDRTVRSWEAWIDEFDYEGPWEEAVRRSALALKLLIFSPTGAIAAAATTGLPENLEGGKNYDYRFAWVRDLAYTVGALIRFGLREETHAAVSWVLKALKDFDGELHIFFELDGTVPEGPGSGKEREVPVEGWNGIGPVLEGNDASGQLQLGVFADVVGIMRRYVEAGNILDERTSELLVRFTDEACRNWQKKDSGMWELPEEQHYTTSKIGCWQAIDDAIHLASLGELKPSTDDLEHWHKNRTLIEEWLADQAWSESRGAYTMHPGSEALDASFLLHTARQFGPPERTARTVARIDEELSAGPLLYRYSNVWEEEGTFVACAFWMVESLALLGQVETAAARMDELVVLGNDVGLYAEMISAEDHAFLGNLPQGLSHLALIDAAIVLRERLAKA